MIINPIIPIWLMAIVCVLFLLCKRKGIFSYIRQIAIVILLFVINLRMMLPGGEAPMTSAGADVLFVIDNTISMLAEDYDGNSRRIDAVKEDCRYIMEQFPGASYSMISFGNKVHTMFPYTIDQSIVAPALDSLNGQSSFHASGTSLNEVMEFLLDTLDNTRENYQIVFFISDGEITTEEKLQVYSELKQYVDAGAVLGYGTTAGGPMQVIPFAGSEDPPEYLYEYDENFYERLSLSKIDENNLKSIASDLGVKYIHMTKQSAIYDEIAKIQVSMEHSVKETQMDSTNGYIDIYYFFVVPLLLLLIVDYVYYRRKMRLDKI
ncbi:MAG: VWA domain-containing protein [Lachnospiraceae bacterium]|nr:VWA domain-containing protein [Lachnospiraceae bacterium]